MRRSLALWSSACCAVFVIAASASADPPTLQGTLRVEARIANPISAQFTRVQAYDVTQVDAQTTEATGSIVVQATDGIPLHFEIDVNHAQFGTEGVAMCGLLNGRSFDTEFVDLPVVTWVFDSGLPGGEGDISYTITGNSTFVEACETGQYPITGDDITRQTIADDISLLFGRDLTVEQLSRVTVSGNVVIENVD